MIIEILDLVLDLVGDLAQIELLLRFGWPRLRHWVFLALDQGDEADLNALADEQLEQLLISRNTASSHEVSASC